MALIHFCKTGGGNGFIPDVGNPKRTTETFPARLHAKAKWPEAEMQMCLMYLWCKTAGVSARQLEQVAKLLREILAQKSESEGRLCFREGSAW